jgi:hypothetical protein
MEILLTAVWDGPGRRDERVAIPEDLAPILLRRYYYEQKKRGENTDKALLGMGTALCFIGGSMTVGALRRMRHPPNPRRELMR